ncbi:MAG: hypothetical protein COT81_01820 [Candidatus Buchananbacteria bacterium CG10_big_fil_rev_8_21_14_0_10_42_9]|uniref:GtrA/DPMS transmembrane domain-containing protein n=1 Tax=Candidatus Buchananbacteria bacterium CG10_big_fil_rev_8_21_14_0_10_42_9 TaxID=1974526 RepID=A0A2H0W1U9_9BACT|nr:MAG: hypothetical protein COT81_01820 [Candidatus Buchananbacteria bacterium CG10_big_fil_rev_8_21_14_0_10_42_9]
MADSFKAKIRSTQRNPYIQFISFGITGTAVAVIDFAVLFALREIAGVQQYIANSIAYATAVTIKFFIHRWWVFHHEATANASSEKTMFAKFVSFNTVGLGINNLVLWLMVFVSSSTPWFYLSKAVATLVVMFWNFFTNKFWTFKAKKSKL